MTNFYCLQLRQLRHWTIEALFMNAGYQSHQILLPLQQRPGGGSIIYKKPGHADPFITHA